MKFHFCAAFISFLTVFFAFPSASQNSSLLFGETFETPYRPVYAVAATAETFEMPEWNRVAEALERKYAEKFDVRRVVITLQKTADSKSDSKPDSDANSDANSDVESLLSPAFLEEFRVLQPYYTCFLLRPEEVNTKIVPKIHEWTRSFDTDPYTDTIWGILTGWNAADALRIAEAPPLEVCRAAAGTPIPLARFREGIWYDEGKKNHYVEKVRKSDGTSEIVEHTDGPDDTTHALADAWKEADLFITSGHASTRDWNPGYAFRNGNFRSKNGKYLGFPLDGKPFEVVCERPKVHIAAGNCLIGGVDGPDCMALAELHSLGVCAFVGYTVPTWYGYMGWGVLEYYLGQPGDFTAAEAFFASNQALTYRLTQIFPELFDDSSQEKIQERFSKMTSGQKHDVQGLLYDRSSVAFYGDPAWHSPLARPDSGTFWHQELSREKNGWTFTVQKTDSSSDEGAAGETRDAAAAGSSDRPLIQLLPPECVPVSSESSKTVKILETEGASPQFMENFLLIPRPSKAVKIRWEISGKE